MPVSEREAIPPALPTLTAGRRHSAIPSPCPGVPLRLDSERRPSDTGWNARIVRRLSRYSTSAARTTMPDATVSASDLKITGVEAIYLRLPEVKTQCDSGQDALIVKVTTDAGIIGYGEVDSNPMAAKGCIEGPFSHTTATGLAHVADRRGPVPDRVPLAQDVPGQHLRRPARDRDPRDERHRPGPLGHQGQGPGPARLEAARRRFHASRCGRTPARCSARRPPRPAIGPGGSPTRGSPRSSSAGTRWARTPRPTSRWSARPAPGSGPTST